MIGELIDAMAAVNPNSDENHQLVLELLEALD